MKKIPWLILFPLLSLSSLTSECAVKPVRLSFVGDIMVHGAQLKRARRDSGRYWDFMPSLAFIAPLFIGSDEVIGNLETTLAGKDGALQYFEEQHVDGYQGYPEFNTPDDLAESLKRSGFTILTTSNNHSFDSGASGLERTNTVLEKNGLRHTGTGRQGKDPLFFTHRGIRFALLSCTYGTNVGWKPVYKPELIHSLENYKSAKIAEFQDEITELRTSGLCDIIIVAVHFGSEYRYDPSPWQKKLTSALLAAGADIIVGHHPHVLQPAEIRTIRDRTGRIRECVVFYSLGNFLSSYRESASYPLFCDTGVVATVEFLPDRRGGGRIKGLSFTPVWMQWIRNVIRILPLGTARSESGKRMYQLSTADSKRLKEAEVHVQEIFGTHLRLKELRKGVWYYDHDDRR